MKFDIPKQSVPLVKNLMHWISGIANQCVNKIREKTVSIVNVIQ